MALERENLLRNGARAAAALGLTAVLAGCSTPPISGHPGLPEHQWKSQIITLAKNDGFTLKAEPAIHGKIAHEYSPTATIVLDIGDCSLKATGAIVVDDQGYITDVTRYRSTVGNDYYRFENLPQLLSDEPGQLGPDACEKINTEEL